jgi:exodeoxyribonuclease VII large subunit
VDTVIIGRGGGSMEDLWASNDETLARTIAACRLPIISAVGHEVDFTICDFVADRRAPTPSAAAELAVPETAELMHKIDNIVGRTQLLLSRSIERRRQTVRLLSGRRIFTQPERMLDDRRMALDAISDSLTRHTEQKLALSRSRMELLAGRINALSPLAVFMRGYAMAEADSGEIVSSVTEVSAGDPLRVRLKDGYLHTTVNSTEKDI